MVRHCLLVVVFLINLSPCQGQDVHFTQWEAAEMAFNPAMASDFDGDWEFRTIYRNQWKSVSDPFTTFSASFTSNLYFLPKGWTVSGMIISDRAGHLVSMKNDQVHAGIGRNWNLSGHELHLAVQGSYAIRGIDWSDVSHADQYNIEIGAFDSNLPTMESGLNQQIKYGDLHGGLMWVKRGDVWDVQAGVGMYHLMRPSDSFVSSDDFRLAMRSTYNASLVRKLDAKGYVGLDLRQMMQIKANELNAKGTYGRYVGKEGKGVNEVFLSVMHRNGIARNGDALMFGVGAASKAIRVFLAYDVNVSGLEVATGNRGAIEFGLIYTSPSSFLDQITIPCDRF